MCQQTVAIQQKIRGTIDKLAAIANELTAISNEVGHVGVVVNSTQTDLVTARAAALPPLQERLVNALNGEYKLRTVSELSTQLAASRTDMINTLENARVAYVIRRRRGDGAELIGLATRNR